MLSAAIGSGDGRLTQTTEPPENPGRFKSAYVLAKGRPQKPLRPLMDVQRWEYSGNKAHPTEKAVSVLLPLVRSFSRPGDMVLDPFSGSGSTLVAAVLSGRRYVGIDVEAKYVDLARRRLAGVERARLRKAG
jgi:adenine-specific DNA-methyltransferase